MGGGTASSSQQGQQQIGIPQDVAALRDALFNQLLLPGVQGAAGAGGLGGVFGSSLELINRSLSDPNLLDTQFQRAQTATAGAQRQQIEDVVIPSVQEAGLLQGVGGGGSSSLQRIGQGAARVQSQLLPAGLQQANRPFDQAFQLASFLSNLFTQGATAGTQAPVLGSSQGKSSSFNANFGLGGGGGGQNPIQVVT